MKKLSKTQLEALRMIADFECHMNTYGHLGPHGSLRCVPGGIWSRSWHVAGKSTLSSLFERRLVTTATDHTYRIYLTERGQMALDGQPEAAV